MAVFAEFRKEAAMMSMFDHPNIVALKGIVKQPYCMVLEFMSEGSLFSYIHEEKVTIAVKSRHF